MSETYRPAPTPASPAPVREAASRGFWAIVGHVLLRLLLVLVGYFVSVMVSLVAIVVFYSILVNLPNPPDYFHALAVSPIVLLFVPYLGIFVFMIAVVVTCLPALIAALFTESFRLRQWWLHAFFGGLIAAAGFAFVSPTFVDGISATDWADLGIIAASGAVGGVFYWLIAGRLAGLMPRPGE